MNIYITGIAGFLGSNLAEYFHRRNHTVTGNDNLVGGDAGNVSSDVRWHRADCHDTVRLTESMRGTEVVYHTAALAHEGLSFFSPKTITDSVYGASVSTFTAAINAGVRKIVFCSSAARYGHGKTPFREEMPPKPCDPYAVAKVAAEDTLRILADTHAVEYTVAVPHNIVGARQKFDDPYRNVLAIMANRLLLGKPPIIYGDGLQTRCFSDVRDLLPVFDRMANEAAGEIVNVGPDEEPVSLLDAARTLCQEAGLPAELTHVPDRPGEIKHSSCSADKSRELFDYKTTYSFRETVRSILSWVRQHGPRDFVYHLPIEIDNKVPVTWSKEMI